MKKILISLVVLSSMLLGCSKTASSDNLSWETNLETALKKAKAENKAVLVNFTGSDWCKWCIKLSDEVFSKSEFEDFAKENLILVKLDFPNSIKQTEETKKYNNQLAQKYGIEGFPSILILNSSGTLVLRTGYQPGGPVEYVKHIQEKI